MGTPINLPTVAAAAQELASLGTWDSRTEFVETHPSAPISVSGNEAVLASWRLLLDHGSLQDGEPNLAGTAHPSIAVISPDRAVSLRVTNGDLLRISTQSGWIMLPCQIADIDNSTIWVPRNSSGSTVIATLGVASGAVVSVVKA